MKVHYDSNNSGGGWWLTDQDWLNLEAAGWKVRWFRDEPRYLFYEKGDRYFGALARAATIEADSVEDAISMWESVTQQDAAEAGCPCCGQPHWFYEEDETPDPGEGE